MKIQQLKESRLKKNNVFYHIVQNIDKKSFAVVLPNIPGRSHSDECMKIVIDKKIFKDKQVVDDCFAHYLIEVDKVKEEGEGYAVVLRIANIESFWNFKKFNYMEDMLKSLNPNDLKFTDLTIANINK